MFVMSKEYSSNVQRLWDVRPEECICSLEEKRWLSDVAKLSLGLFPDSPKTNVFQWPPSGEQLTLGTLQSDVFRLGTVIFNRDFSTHCEVIEN